MSEEESIPLVTLTYNVFDMFESISEFLKDAELVEISLKQSQITLIFDKDILRLNDLNLLTKYINELVPTGVGEAYFTSLNDIPMIVIPEINVDGPVFRAKSKNNTFMLMMNLITTIAEKICTCPSLEIIFSDTYLKCYLDKPGLTVSNLMEYEKLFNLEGSLELHAQRPYLLFIREAQ